MSAMKSELIDNQEMGCSYSHAVVRLINIIANECISLPSSKVQWSVAIIFLLYIDIAACLRYQVLYNIQFPISKMT